MSALVVPLDCQLADENLAKLRASAEEHILSALASHELVQKHVDSFYSPFLGLCLFRPDPDSPKGVRFAWYSPATTFLEISHAKDFIEIIETVKQFSEAIKHVPSDSQTPPPEPPSTSPSESQPFTPPTDPSKF
jgi:hypothetical protein